jgi:carbonic anhydrase
MSATNDLIKGYKEFREEYYLENKETLQQLANEGQAPKVCLISCCDSRVEPAIILNCDPGDLFVVRNVANLVPPCELNSSAESYHGTSAALEFAINGLEVESIIVLGHAHCGGIKALMDRRKVPDEKSFIHKWMSQLNTVKERIYEDSSIDNQESRYQACEEMAIVQSLTNLMTFPWVKERVEQGTLELHGWYYDIRNSKLYELNPDTNTFHKIAL